MGAISNPAVVAELKELQVANRGFLRAEYVLERAKVKSSALHSCFTWDDGEAAERYRLEEAHRLIRVVVALVPELKTEEPVRVFVSLRGDRTPVGGYRAMVNVLADSDLRARLLEEALADMKIFELRYARLSELAVWNQTRDA